LFTAKITATCLIGAQLTHLRAGEAGKRESIVVGDSHTKAIEGTPAANDNQGDFSNFPEIPAKTVEGLKKRGINSLFPV